jgi:sn-glycerol 3-phosphate transport system ATP-binding protein
LAGVTIRGIEKVYPGGFQAIRGIDMEISDGELIVLVGPSGCGKSTLLRMIAGLERISAGEVLVAGKVVNDLEPADRDMAMVFQNYALYPHMSVFNNMAYGLRNRGTPRDEISRRVAEAADILELAELLERKPRQLSGGQRQRVAMGRAIVREPQVFLFDEPLSNLDAKLRVQMRLEIKRLQKRLGTTSIYVTHDQVEAMTLADRLMVMNAGVAEQFGTPMEVYERPASVFVASFIGSPAMNFLAAELGADRHSVRLADGDLLRLDSRVSAVAPGTRLQLGVRPEHLSLTEGANSAIHLEADLIEELGSDTVVHGRLPSLQETMTVRLPGRSQVSAGEVIALTVEPQSLHLFDRQSGARVG